jgi:hypothetical protein
MARIIFYAIAVIAGSLSLAGVLAASAAALGHPPTVVLGVVAIVAAATTAGLIPSPFPTSPWRVPRGWGQAGDSAFAGLFGYALGLGFLTAIPSAAFYVLVTWALSVGWGESWLAFVSFGIGRCVPLMAAAFLSVFARDVVGFTTTAKRMVGWIRPVEVMLLSAIAAVLLG